MEERQHTGNDPVPVPDREDFAVLLEGFEESMEQPPREDRRAEAVNALGVDVVDGVDAPGQSRL